jgi:hypothetical protein
MFISLILLSFTPSYPVFLVFVFGSKLFKLENVLVLFTLALSSCFSLIVPYLFELCVVVEGIFLVLVLVWERVLLFLLVEDASTGRPCERWMLIMALDGQPDIICPIMKWYVWWACLNIYESFTDLESI